MGASACPKQRSTLGLCEVLALLEKKTKTFPLPQKHRWHIVDPQPPGSRPLEKVSQHFSGDPPCFRTPQGKLFQPQVAVAHTSPARTRPRLGTHCGRCAPAQHRARTARRSFRASVSRRHPASTLAAQPTRSGGRKAPGVCGSRAAPNKPSAAPRGRTRFTR